MTAREHFRYTGKGPSPYIEVTYPPGPTVDQRRRFLDYLVRSEIRHAYAQKEFRRQWEETAGKGVPS